MNPNYIIVQAGGKGSRMQSLTRNKPKALVPINNLPMIFHLFKKYPNKKFVVIGDYKFDVLERYLAAFAEVEYHMVCATGNEGTCAGLTEALTYIPEGEEVALIWCDLVLSDEYQFPEQSGNYIGIAKDFECRWSYEEGKFAEKKSDEQGVAGYFIFEDKSILNGVPASGELVRWMRDNNLVFIEQELWHTHEYGLYSEWERLPKTRCRSFNSIEIKGDKFIKHPIDAQGKQLAERECSWYKKVKTLLNERGGVNIPEVYSYNPLTMRLIEGKNLYEYTDIPHDYKLKILKKVVESLNIIHSLESIPADKHSYYEAYIGKTMQRLEKVKNLVPFAAERRIKINGKDCRNIFYHWDMVKESIEGYMPKEFVLLHGDCTFSNIMIENDEVPILFDPRGYFGNTELYGDEAYDWAKLYYSIVSNYDQFNLKRFSLDILDDEVVLDIESNHWEDMESDFFVLIEGKVSRKQLKLFLAIIWLSLTTYAWEDYDSICGAFYQGLLYFEEALLMSEEDTGDKYFDKTIKVLTNSLNRLDMNSFEGLIKGAQDALQRGHKIIVTGLGKNVPVCEKFVGTMISLGLDANFMHTNTAVHGDLGMVKPGDLVIILSKSGNTIESVCLAKLLRKRKVSLKSITFSENNDVADIVGHENNIVIHMEHEGDMWNIVPNNSTILNLIILQGLAMTIAERMDLQLERDFKPNHPGGAIGKELRHGKKS